MKQLVIATTNLNKVRRLKLLLKDLDYEILSLNDIVSTIPEPNENANTPIGIAIEKASHYVEYLPDDTLILTQDDTIQFEGVEDSDNPGVHIKNPVVEKYGEFTDEYAAEYYKNLANKYSGKIPMTFKYGHAVAIKENNGERKITKIVSAGSELKVRLVNEINKLEKSKGYFLAALMEAKVDDEWIKYNELDEDVLVKLDNDLYKSIKSLLESIN